MAITGLHGTARTEPINTKLIKMRNETRAIRTVEILLGRKIAYNHRLKEHKDVHVISELARVMVPGDCLFVANIRVREQ